MTYRNDNASLPFNLLRMNADNLDDHYPSLFISALFEELLPADGGEGGRGTHGIGIPM
jgi:hypothetical protein